MNYTRSKHSAKKITPVVWVVIGVLVLGAIFAGLELTNVTHFFHKDKSVVLDVSSKTPTKGGATGSNQKGEPQTSTSPSSSTTNGSQPGDAKSNSGATTSLLTPSGVFVSNHHPNLGGTPAPYTMSSVCTTTPGATCTIKFTKNGITKSLAARTVDSNGSAYWDWKLQDIGLTAGSWQIQAVATLNGATKTASDIQSLEVSP